MSEVSLYRKYRPQSFEDVIGQEHIVETLRGALQKGVGHAYLFIGPRGTGKTSVARIFARELGAVDMDIYEFDAATNTGIDDVRELKEAVHTAPFLSPRKVYIIDEVHMFSKGAFNGLLKMLEEPPSHAVFILATTEFHKVPDTVVSRCQHIAFRKPNRQILARVIADTAKKEGYALARDAVAALAFHADGSFRDAHGALQKVMNAVSEKKITREDVERFAGVPSRACALRYLVALLSGSPEDGMRAVGESVAAGGDMREFLAIVLDCLRLWMIKKYSPAAFSEYRGEFDEADLVALDAAAAASSATVKPSALIKDLISASEMLRFAAIPSLPLEMLIIERASASAGK